MNINAVKTSADPATASRSLDRQWLTRSRDDNSLEAQSRKLVAQFFFGTLLKQMRSSTMGTGIFDGGSGGRSFQAMLDQRISEGLSDAPAGRKIAESLVQSLSPLKSNRELPLSLEDARKANSRKHHAPTVKRSPKAASATSAATDILSAGAASSASVSIDMKG